jgi:hypothetical protein
LDEEEEEEEEEKEKEPCKPGEKGMKGGVAEGPSKSISYFILWWCTDHELSTKKVRRNPDAFPPKTAFGRFVVKLAPVFRFFKSPQGILALRNGIVSIALWVPAVCSTSAWFYYDNKGIWALIMAQVRELAWMLCCFFEC